ncbi:hypothetical protein AB0I53_19415 [Saccharopolyspora sp. NPDC050389]|uniref:hypothetical protein n=1 Tax=Saccharopolyspora sp. NPDC050389 TaxID=3155516 RepID=UPI0033D2F1E0
MFVLDKAHIDGLVHAGIRLGMIDVADANATGRMLLDQHYRCPGFVNGSMPSDYTVQTA